VATGTVLLEALPSNYARQSRKCATTLSATYGLSVCYSVNKVTLALRQMFVDRMLEPDEELAEFVRNGDPDILSRNIEQVRCPGFFNNELGDFVMKAVSSILRIPIQCNDYLPKWVIVLYFICASGSPDEGATNYSGLTQASIKGTTNSCSLSFQ